MIYVMRKEFGMSAREVWTSPEWELDALIDGHNEANSES